MRNMRRSWLAVLLPLVSAAMVLGMWWRRTNEASMVMWSGSINSSTDTKGVGVTLYYFSSPGCGWSQCDAEHYFALMTAITTDTVGHEGWRLAKYGASPVFV